MKPAAKNAMLAFGTLMDEVVNASKELPARLLIDKVLQVIKYQDYLEENFSPPEVEAKTDTINELKNLASRYDDLPPEESLMDFLEDILITAEQNDDGEREKSRPHDNAQRKVTRVRSCHCRWSRRRDFSSFSNAL